MTKGPNAFRTISEAADEIGVPQHVLRFWESKFSFIRPMKRAGGRRFYRPQDIAVLTGVRQLLHSEGYTIKGVQKLHKELGMRRVLAATDAKLDGGAEEAIHADAPPVPATAATGVEGPALSDAGRARLSGTLAELTAIKARLDGLLKS